MSIASLVKRDPASSSLVSTFIDREVMDEFMKMPIEHQMSVGVVHGLLEDNPSQLVMEIQTFESVPISPAFFRHKLLKKY